MSSHDSFLANIWEHWPQNIGRPEVIAKAMLLRLFEEGRITTQEFHAIDDGFRSMAGLIKRHTQAAKARPEAKGAQS